MFYKVIKDGKIIDVLDGLVFLKYQAKHDRMIFCNEDYAQAIISSDGKHIWHEATLYKIPVDGYDTVRVEEIDGYEYKQLKALHGKTAEEIIDEFVALMLDNEMKLLADSLKRLYENNRVDESKVIALCDNGYITNDQKGYVLGN